MASISIGSKDSILLHAYVPRNLGICAISKLCCAFSNSGNYLRLCTGAAQSRNCATLVHNFEIDMQFLDSENAQHNLEIA